MTVTAISRKAGPFSGVGLTSFAFSFKCANASELTITHTTSAGVETTLVKDVGYTVSLYSDQDSVPGGTITLSTALLSGEKLTITSGIELTQPTAILNAGAFLPQVVEETFDRLEMQIQQQQVDIDRCVKVDVSESVTADELRQALLDGSTANALSAAASATSAAASASQVAAFIPAAVGGRVIGVRTGDNAFSFYAPNGTKITDTATSLDGTKGINTCLDIAAGEGWEFELHGGGISGWTYGSSVDAATIVCETSIVVRPAQLRRVWFGPVTLQMSISGSAPGLSINSGMMLNFTSLGQIVYTGTGFAVDVNPSAGVPLDGLVVMVDSDIHIQTAVSKGAGIVAVRNANRCKIHLGEMNGNNGAYSDDGVKFFNCIGNIVDIGAIHEASSVSLGLDATSNYNTLRVGAIEPALKSGNNPVGMSCYGSYNNVDMTALSTITTLYRGFSLESGANYNYVHARKIGTTSNVPYYDGGTGNHGRVNGTAF